MVPHLGRNWKIENRKWKLETGNWKLETGNWKFEIGDSKIETRIASFGLFNRKSTIENRIA
jgi:hypothetical protein